MSELLATSFLIWAVAVPTWVLVQAIDLATKGGEEE